MKKIPVFLISFFFFLIFLGNPLMSKVIVDIEWVSKNSCNSNIITIEVGKSYKSFLNNHIPCAIFTDFYKDGWREKNNKGVGFSLPKVNKLVHLIGKMGISSEKHIILYGRGENKYNLAELTSVYFTFKYLGHKNISIMDGGIKDYMEVWSNDVDVGKNEPLPRVYKAKLNESIIAFESDVRLYIKKKLKLVDSRDRDYFLGINKITKFDQYGTISISSINIPSEWASMDRNLKFNKENILKSIFHKKGVSKDERIIFFCYAGLESSVNWFVAHEILGYTNAKLYEGSIFDWVNNDKNKLIKLFDVIY